MKIRCSECKKQIASKKDDWVEIEGKTKYRSNGKESYIVCTKCGTENKIH